MNVSLTYLGILIALNTIVWDSIHDSPFKFVLFNIVTILICAFINWVETKLRNIQSTILDFLIYVITPLYKKDYKINSRIETYSINSKNNATFESIANIKVIKTPDDFGYIDRFQWEQDEKFDIQVDEEYRYLLEEDLNWIKITIIPKSFLVIKNMERELKYYIKNLYFTNLKKHSFFSCNPKEKMKVLKMIAYVDNSLCPNTYAKYIIQNKNGDIIHSEELQYDLHTQSYEKTIKYPRKSRKYIIKWDYGLGAN